MDKEALKNIKEKIDKRFSKLCKVNYLDAGNELRIFFNYLLSVQFIRSNLEKLNAKADNYLEKINSLSNIGFYPQNEFEKQYMSYALIKKCCEDKRNYPQWEIVKKISNRLANMGAKECVEYFHSKFVYTIVEYLKESMDESNNMLAILLKYKQKCEWFRKNQLNQIIENNSKIAEHLLASDLFEYFFDNGIQLFIEPKSSSGRSDFISIQKSEDHLVADTKIFNPSLGKDKSYIANGFKQIYDYAQDYNEPIGYMVIFKTCAEDIKFSLTNITNHIPFLVYNNK
ncbi:MAG: hypothetical protein A2V66_17570, partial [Ignavibacteria bacterium RBG_13_36_8]